MKKCILAAAALTAGSLFAGNGTWVYRAGIGTTPTNAADWTDSANWKDGIVATGSTAVANLTVGSGTVWVRIPDNFVVNRIDANSGSTLKLRLICDGTLRLTDGGRIRGAQNNRPNVWADLISVDGLFNPYYSDFSSPMKMTKGLYWGPSGGLFGWTTSRPRRIRLFRESSRWAKDTRIRSIRSISIPARS